jgi:signal transduction histidine kinase
MTRSLACGGGDAKRHEILKYMEAALQGMQAKFDLLTLLSRIECQFGAPVLQPCGLGRIWRDLSAGLRATAEGQGVRLRSRVRDIQVTSDPALLPLLVKSLVLNAVKLTNNNDVLVASRRRADASHLELYFRGSEFGEMPHRGAFVNVSSRDEATSSELGLGLGFVARLANHLGHYLDCTDLARGGVRIALFMAS